MGHALLIAAADCSDHGKVLWDGKNIKGQGNEAWQSIAEKNNF
jgi:hypothetical protein